MHRARPHRALTAAQQGRRQARLSAALDELAADFYAQHPGLPSSTPLLELMLWSRRRAAAAAAGRITAGGDTAYERP